MDGFPVVGSVADALPLGPTTALVGVATQGGRFPPAWRELLESCIAAGLDVENGLHEFVSDDPGARRARGAPRRRAARPAQAAAGPERPDRREPRRTPRGSCCTVGSDCAIGKMTVALELDAEARRRGLASEFVPTGQTGIAIAGWGLSVDAVVSDFVAGAAEQLVLEGVARGGELLFVEGQGSLLHPAYSGVTLGLMHGSAPHAYVLCHLAGQTVRRRRRALPDAAALGARRPARAHLAARAAGAGRRDRAEHARPRRRTRRARRSTRPRSETGLPADDPVRFGAGAAARRGVLALGLTDDTNTCSLA